MASSARAGWPAAVLSVGLACAPAFAGGTPKTTVLYSFTGGAGGEWYPVSTPFIGPRGVLYGTTSGNGGITSNGTVFSLTPPAGAGAWREQVLYQFGGGGDGALPVAGVVGDTAGNLYGTTSRGGDAGGCGTVFRLAPPPAGGTVWTHSVLHSFACAPTDGQTPVGTLSLDASGNLLGTTSAGGGAGMGTVFKLAPPALAGTPWTETILYAFQGGQDGAAPAAGLLITANGALLGSTSAGGGAVCGVGGCGTVFALTATADGGWTETVLHRFTGGDDGATPLCTLTTDASGTLYGTTSARGVVAAGASAAGTVFKMMPSNGQWPLTTLYTFSSGYDGASPQAGVLSVRDGALYGTTAFAGSNGAGTVFKLAKPGQATGAWRIAVLHGFGGPGDGAKPLAGLALSAAHAVYGTTFFGGALNGAGTVFSVSQ